MKSEGREIKFRFWSPENVMLNEHDGWTDGIGINEALIYSSMYDYKIMQYTGLHDKNGKEVYEGDILCNPNQLKGIVVYHEAGFYLEAKRKNGDVWYMPLNSGMLRNKEIIGNIYENEKNTNN